MTNKLTLIKRSTPACPACNGMEFILQQEGIEFEAIDIALAPEAVEQYDISSVPVMLIGEGDEQVRLNGIQPPELVRELMEEV